MCVQLIEFVKTRLQSFRISYSHLVNTNLLEVVSHSTVQSLCCTVISSLCWMCHYYYCWTTLMFGCATDYTVASPMAYSSSDDDEDFLRSFFHAQFTSLFAPQTSQTELLIRSCGDPERLDRWEQIAPFFRMLR